VAPHDATQQAGRMTSRVHGHDVAWRTLGRGPLDVVLVHGIGVSGRYFANLARELSRSARVVIPDLPGFGDSPRPPTPLSIVEHAEVVAGMAVEAGLDRPVLVGHSMGAQVVTELALRHPGAVGGVVLVGPVTDPSGRSGLRQGLRLLRDAAHEPPGAIVLQLREWLRCGPRWYAATLPGMLEYPMEERVADLQVDVVLVRGARDPVAPAAYLARLADRAPQATSFEVPGAGHVAMFRRPEYVAAAAVGLAS